MRANLQRWIADAGTLTYAEQFARVDFPVRAQRLATRADDFFLSLVGELFDQIRERDGRTADDVSFSADWAALANAFAEFGFIGQPDDRDSVPRDTHLFAATAFYLGGYPASASLMLSTSRQADASPGHIAAHELLSRSRIQTSGRAARLVEAVRDGDARQIAEEMASANGLVESSLAVGPEEWVGWRLYKEIAQRLLATNVRSVLPDEGERFWDPLVASFFSRTPPVWDFFPSQIAAIRQGLTSREDTFSLQMPTGAGKTALTEAVLFSHLTKHPDGVAIVLVPYRSLASELRETLVRNLRGMGFRGRTHYGGTVPTVDELHSLDTVRVIVATPEALSGLLSADQSLLHRVSLLVCDEGHLLDGDARGVGLELLLARMRALDTGRPRFVFVSAIVPNIDEINGWLGGSDDTVVKSTYRPALAEFARLEPKGSGVARTVKLRFEPHQHSGFEIPGFLGQEDFRYRNPSSGRFKTRDFSSVKTQAVATARKALPMGVVAVFAANKRGKQGCVGLAQELLAQLEVPLPLPTPLSHAREAEAEPRHHAVEYLELEYGQEWIGTRALVAGAVIHHGDIPQESREILESLVRAKAVPLVFCTTTLAEGVNLPIRTLVLYSVVRRLGDRRSENLRARDIKNLVGRAGRPGATTKGLVVCANPNQWNIIAPVAQELPGERVRGALLTLMERLRAEIVMGLALSNDYLELESDLHTLVDGVDATLIDLAAEELGEDQLVQIARELTTQTYAAIEADVQTAALMREVFELRARRVAAIQSSGRLGWIRETGARVRMIDLVEEGLLPAREHWDDIDDPLEDGLIDPVLDWAWGLPEMAPAVTEGRLDPDKDQELYRAIVKQWISGAPPVDIAHATGMDIDDFLTFRGRVIAYDLPTVVEQGVAILSRLYTAEGRSVSSAVMKFPEHLKFGVPNYASRILAGTLRHRRAAVALGQSPELATSTAVDLRDTVLGTARRLAEDRNRWLPQLGHLVLNRTLDDLEPYSRDESAGDLF